MAAIPGDGNASLAKRLLIKSKRSIHRYKKTGSGRRNGEWERVFNQGHWDHQKRFAKGGFWAMMRKRVNSFLLKLRYLMLLAEINVLIGLSGVRRELDLRKPKP